MGGRINEPAIASLLVPRCQRNHIVPREWKRVTPRKMGCRGGRSWITGYQIKGIAYRDTPLMHFGDWTDLQFIINAPPPILSVASELEDIAGEHLLRCIRVEAIGFGPLKHGAFRVQAYEQSLVFSQTECLHSFH